MKKDILKYVISILLLISLAANVYLFKTKNKLVLPIYEVTYSKTGVTDISNNIDNSYTDNYKLIIKKECNYDVCYWYDYNVSSIANAKWIYYDNNASNKGGYYIYDQKSNKTIYGPYKNIIIDINELSDNILQGAFLYSDDDKVGYFDLRGLNKMLFKVEYDNIVSSQLKDFYVTKNNGVLTLYSFLSNKLVKISDDIDSYSFVRGSFNDYVIKKKNNKYNLVYVGDNVETFETNDDYEFLNVYEVKEDNGYATLYFVYGKDGETYISKTDIFTLRNNNSLIIDSTFNHKISTKNEGWRISSTDTNEILGVYSNIQSDEYYTINLNNNEIEKKYNSN